MAKYEGRLMFYSNVIYISRFRMVNKPNEILLKVLEKEERERESRVWFGAPESGSISTRCDVDL